MNRHPRRLLLTPGIALVLLAVVSAIGALGSLRIHIDEDIASLLPGRDDSALEAVRKWGLMKKVLVVIGPSPSADDTDSLVRAIDDAADRLSTLPGIARVTAAVDTEAGLAAARVIARNAAKLYRPEVEPLEPGDIPKRLTTLKQRLASPEAIALQEMMLADPLGVGRAALQSLEATGSMMGAVVEDSHLLSADRRYGLLVLELAFDPMLVTQSKPFVEALGKALVEVKRGDLDAFALGGPHFVVTSAEGIGRDIRVAFSFTALLVVLIFWWFFGRLRLLPLALLPGGIGILTAMAAMGFLGIELHALTLGFAATITGISVDYVIHLLYRALANGESDTADRMSWALAKVTRPVVLGCLTTVGAFAIVAMSGFTGVRQLAVFSIISLPTALAVTLFLVPAFHRFSLSRGRKRELSTLSRFIDTAIVGAKGRAAVVLLFVGIIAVASLLATKVELSGDPRMLGYTDPEIGSRESRLKEVFPGVAHQAMLLSFGRTEEEALSRNDELYDALREAGFEASDIVSVGPFLPSKKRQRAASEALGELLDSEETVSAFNAAGFKPGYIAEIERALRAGPVSRKDYQNTGLEGLVEEAIVEDGPSVQVLTRVKAVSDDVIERLERIVRGTPGCRLVSERIESRRALGMLQQEMIWMLAIWLSVAVAALSVVERSFKFGVTAALPALFGVAVTLGLFGLVERVLTPVASAGLTLVMGLGIDYGIFMQFKEGRAKQRETALAVTASALTTLAAFGVLAFAKTRAMADIGLIVLVGVSSALLASIVVVPMLARAREEEN